MQAEKVAAGEGLAWIACGLRLFRRDPAMWMTMAVIYFVVALALKRIPFMGNLVLILITPALLAGALLTARELDEPAGAASPGTLKESLPRAPQRLFRVFTHGDKALAATITCIVTLGLTMVAIIIDYLLTGGSMLTGLTGGGLEQSLRPLALLGGIVVLLLYGLLALSLFHLVHLTTFAGLEALAALATGVRGAVRNVVPLLVFAIGFLIVVALIVAAFGSGATRWLGYVLLFGAGSPLLPIFVAGSYCSYKTLYASRTAPAPATT